MVDPIGFALADDALRRLQKNLAGETAPAAARARRSRRRRPPVRAGLVAASAARGFRAAPQRS